MQNFKTEASPASISPRLLPGRVHVKSPREERLLSTDKNPSSEKFSSDKNPSSAKFSSEDKKLPLYETLYILRRGLTETIQNIGTKLSTLPWMQNTVTAKLRAWLQKSLLPYTVRASTLNLDLIILQALSKHLTHKNEDIMRLFRYDKIFLEKMLDSLRHRSDDFAPRYQGKNLLCR